MSSNRSSATQNFHPESRFIGKGPVHSAIRRTSIIQNSTLRIHNYLSVFPCLQWLIISVKISVLSEAKSRYIGMDYKNEQTNPFSK
jgi:hypothetical protein